MKRIIMLCCLLVALTAAQAQENKGAQRLHNAFVQFVSKYSRASYPQLNLVLGNAAGGLLPRSKQHVVKTSKSSAWVGTQYFMDWTFDVNIAVKSPDQLLKSLQQAFDKESGRCASCYNYFTGDGQGRPIFPGLHVTWGPGGHEVSQVPFHSKMNVRVMTFVDADGFRSTYLLQWAMLPIGQPVAGSAGIWHLAGRLAWFYCDAVQTPVAPLPSAGDELADAQLPSALVMATDSTVQLNDLRIRGGRHVTYNTLLAKVERMHNLLMATASPAERTAIVYTLNKVCTEFDALLSPWQYEALSTLTANMAGMLPAADDRAMAAKADQTLKEKLNRTPDMASLRAEDQAYLNAKGFHLLRHDVCHDHITYDGQYYAGDEQVKYLDTYDSDGEQKYHAEKVVTGLEPGVYRLRVATRASGPGAFIYLLGDRGEKQLREIPVFFTEGGNIWADAVKRIHDLTEAGREGEVSGYDKRVANANGGRGFGWNRLVIDEVEVKDGTVKYGVTTLPEFTGKRFSGTWFSACDFELERLR